MKTPALIALCLALTACQTFNLDFLKPAAAEEPIEERIPDDPNHAQLYHLMKANRARMKAENPQSKLSHKTIISELLPGEQADIEIELDAGQHYTLFAMTSISPSPPATTCGKPSPPTPAAIPPRPSCATPRRAAANTAPASSWPPATLPVANTACKPTSARTNRQ